MIEFEKLYKIDSKEAKDTFTLCVELEHGENVCDRDIRIYPSECLVEYQLDSTNALLVVSHVAEVDGQYVLIDDRFPISRIVSIRTQANIRKKC